MKHHFKRVPIFIYLCLVSILYSCTQEKEYLQNNNGDFKFTQKPINELLKLESFKTSYDKVAYVKQKNLASRSALEDEFNFTIVEDRDVNVIEKEGFKYYNILIERSVKDSLFLENLVLKVDETADEGVLAQIF